MFAGWWFCAAPTRGLGYSVVLAGLLLGATVAYPADSTACGVSTAEAVTVAAVTDERTFRLLDETEVRLAGLAGLTDAGGTVSAAVVRARAELGRLVLGKTVRLLTVGEDRYGRRIALAAAGTGDRPGPSVQEHLLARGHALVAARADLAACAAPFQEAERGARDARLGLWAVLSYVIRSADRPETLTAARGRFALVEGKVLSVNDRGATVYVNFGRRWSEDFTVTIAKRNMGSFTAAGIESRQLAGRRVRIRGWIDERGGPWIEAVRPEQIEFTDRH